MLSVLLAHEIHICILSHCFWPFTAMGLLVWYESISEGMWRYLAEGQDMVEKVPSCFLKDFLLAKLMLVWGKGRCGERPRGFSRVVVVERGGWSLTVSKWQRKELWKAPKPGTSSQNLKQRSQRRVSEGARRKLTWWPRGSRFRWPEGDGGVRGILLLWILTHAEYISWCNRILSAEMKCCRCC